MEIIQDGVHEIVELILTTEMTNGEISQELGRRTPYVVGVIRAKLTQVNANWDQVKAMNDSDLGVIMKADKPIHPDGIKGGDLQ